MASELYFLVLGIMSNIGLPKLITYSHRMMSSLDASELMPDAHGETMNRHLQNRRWYTPLPSLHVSLTFPHPCGVRLP